MQKGCFYRHRQWSRSWTTMDGEMERVRQLAFIFGPLKAGPVFVCSNDRWMRILPLSRLM